MVDGSNVSFTAEIPKMCAFDSRWRTRPHRRLLTGLSVSAVCLAGLVGCGDLNDFVQPTITPAQLSGEWRATDLVLTNQADPTQSFDVIDAGGSLFLRFSLEGEFQSIIQAPDQDDNVETGTYEIVNDFIVVQPTEAPQDTIQLSYEFQDSNTRFTLVILSDDFDYDFDGNGNEVPALLFTIVNR